MDESWWLFFCVGLLAQLVDGALGMAFGVTATTVMLSFGVSPAHASAMTHIAEIFTTAASGASHWWHRNIDWGIVRRIALPGVVGGAIGATVLANVDGKVIAPLVTIYLALMGLVILARALHAFPVVESTKRSLPAVGFVGGALDAVGGGGWGPVVTSTLIGGGHVPRKVIGSVRGVSRARHACAVIWRGRPRSFPRPPRLRGSRWGKARMAGPEMPAFPCFFGPAMATQCE